MVGLEKLSKKELYEIAKEKNIKGRSAMSRDELINAISEVINTEQLVEMSKYDVGGSPIGYHIDDKCEIKEEVTEDYKIPEKYNVDMLMFLPIDAKRAYVCWELTKDKLETFLQGNIINHFKIVLRLCTNEDGTISEVKVSENGNYFFNNGMLEDKEAWAEIGIDDGDGFKVIIRSNSFKMPSEKISERDDVTYMTVRSQIEKIIYLSMKGMDGYYSSIDLYKNVLKSISSKNNSEWR